MTEKELNRVITENSVDISNAMHSCCTDYACVCHFHVPKLVEHIRHLESIIGDRMEESDFLLKAGAAEERDRIMQWMRGSISHLGRPGSVVPLKQKNDLEVALNVFLSSLEKLPAELLPPSEARVEAERLKAENKKLRKEVEELKAKHEHEFDRYDHDWE